MSEGQSLDGRFGERTISCERDCLNRWRDPGGESQDVVKKPRMVSVWEDWRMRLMGKIGLDYTGHSYNSETHLAGTGWMQQHTSVWWTVRQPCGQRVKARPSHSTEHLQISLLGHVLLSICSVNQDLSSDPVSNISTQMTNRHIKQPVTRFTHHQTRLPLLSLLLLVGTSVDAVPQGRAWGPSASLTPTFPSALLPSLYIPPPISQSRAPWLISIPQKSYYHNTKISE